ncbi:hypothetical protein VP01_1794g1 [Puccinia sorghi]|uniref:Uncharacterized protein n=1 Tax=Puccinia sorghi TaxID=27349 RepID=A0A0L6VEG3_9BASI|nr:hypothetical protein VP01_1794g1 [Puccinia sorghi]
MCTSILLVCGKSFTSFKYSNLIAPYLFTLPGNHFQSPFPNHLSITYSTTQNPNHGMKTLQPGEHQVACLQCRNSVGPSKTPCTMLQPGNQKQHNWTRPKKLETDAISIQVGTFSPICCQIQNIPHQLHQANTTYSNHQLVNCYYTFFLTNLFPFYYFTQISLELPRTLISNNPKTNYTRNITNSAPPQLFFPCFIISTNITMQPLSPYTPVFLFICCFYPYSHNPLTTFTTNISIPLSPYFSLPSVLACPFDALLRDFFFPSFFQNHILALKSPSYFYYKYCLFSLNHFSPSAHRNQEFILLRTGHSLTENTHLSIQSVFTPSPEASFHFCLSETQMKQDDLNKATYVSSFSPTNEKYLGGTMVCIQTSKMMLDLKLAAQFLKTYFCSASRFPRRNNWKKEQIQKF